MLWAMWGWVFLAVFQGFAVPKILGGFFAFEQAAQEGRDDLPTE